MRKRAIARTSSPRRITLGQTAGNGVVTTQSFDPHTGRLTAAVAGSTVENFSYNYDLLGNLLTRTDANTSLTETLTYDTLNRLTSATVSQNITPVKTFSYDPVGNLLSKSNIGTYTYPVAGAALPHAVQSISGTTINTTFTYDANGNQTAGLGRSISYTSYNKPSSITQGSSTLFFSDYFDHQRFKQTAAEASGSISAPSGCMRSCSPPRSRNGPTISQPAVP